MDGQPSLLLALDLTGTFAFGLNGALTAVRAVHLDVVGVVALGMIIALGGGAIRDVLIGAVPPETFVDWRYFALAAGGGLLAFGFSRFLDRLETPITVLDAIGLSTFAVIGASKALTYGLGVGPRWYWGRSPGWGRHDPGHSHRVDPVGAAQRAVRDPGPGRGGDHGRVETGVYGLPAALVAVAACFVIRMLGVRLELNAPRPPWSGSDAGPPDGR